MFGSRLCAKPLSQLYSGRDDNREKPPTSDFSRPLHTLSTWSAGITSPRRMRATDTAHAPRSAILLFIINVLCENCQLQRDPLRVADGQLPSIRRPVFAMLNCCAGANHRVSPSSGEFTWKVFRRVPPWERFSFTATYIVPRSAI